MVGMTRSTASVASMQESASVPKPCKDVENANKGEVGTPTNQETSRSSIHSTNRSQHHLPTMMTAKELLLMALLSIVIYGLTYLLYLPASLRQHLKQVMSEENFETHYQLLFTVVSLTGIVLPLFAGAVVDRTGGKVVIFVTSVTCLIGQIVAAIGVQNGSWPTLLSGRFVYGLGVQGVFVSTDAFLADVFEEGRKLGLAFGILMTANYVGFLVSTILSPVAANRVSPAFAFWLGAMLEGFSVLAAVMVSVIGDGKKIARVADEETSCQARTREANNDSNRAPADTNDRIGGRNGVPFESAIDEGLQTQETESCSGSNEVHHCRWLNFGLLFWLLCFSCLLFYAIVVSFTATAQGILFERNLFIEPPKDCKLYFPDQCSSGYLVAPGGNPSTDTTGETCPTGGNYAPVIPSSLNVTERDSLWDEVEYVFPFLETSDIDCTDDFWSEACTSNYCVKQEDVTEEAGVLMAVPFMITMTSAFLFGHFGVDRAGRRAEMLCFGPTLLVIANALFAFSQNTPITPLVFMGLGQSITVSALWSSAPLIVPDNSKGMAFGIMTCGQGIGMSLWPLMNASIYNSTGHRYLPEVAIFLMSCSVLAVLVGFALLYADRRSGGRLRTRAARHHEEDENDDIQSGTSE